MNKRRVVVCAGVACALAAAVLVNDAGSSHAGPTPVLTDIVVRGGVGAISIEQSPSMLPTHIDVRSGSGVVVASGTTDEQLGGLLLDESLVSPIGEPLAPGRYQVIASNTPAGTDERSLGTAVVLDETPSPGDGWPYGAQDLLSQSSPVDLNPGDVPELDGVDGSQFRYGYLSTRDGTLLSYFLALPNSCPISALPVLTTTTGATTTTVSPTTTTTAPPPEGAAATCAATVPTLLEYSMYDPSNPTPLVPRDADRFVSQGYAVMGVNVRGTGCSGGAMRRSLLSTVEALDGYDVVETIAAQPWSNQRVGMVGHSGPGMTQWNVARTKPPHLAAIVPAATVARMTDMAWPGGIENDWASEGLGRILLGGHSPAAWDAEQRWAAAGGEGREIDGLAFAHAAIEDELNTLWFGHRRVHVDHDSICATNQRLRGYNLSVADLLDSAPSDSDLARINATDHLGDIDVPTLIVQATTDQLAGLGAAELAAGLPPIAAEPTIDGPYHRMVVGNGDHDSSRTIPAFRDEVEAFLDVFVAGTAPATTDDCQDSALIGGDHGAVLAALWADDPVRIVGEVGARFGGCGHRWEVGLPGWPPAGGDAVTLVTFQAYQGNLLIVDEPGTPPRTNEWFDAGENTTGELAGDYTNSPANLELADSLGDATVLPSESLPQRRQLRRPQRPPASSDTAAFDSLPIGAPRLFVGPATAHVEGTVTPLGAPCTPPPDEPIDLEVTIWEVTQEHRQVFVQSGWQRTEIARDSCAGSFATDVAIGPMAHLFRSTSTIRVSISAPGYTTPAWYLLAESDSSTVTIDTTATELTATTTNVVPAFPSAGPTDGDSASDTYIGVGEALLPKTSLLGQQWSTSLGAPLDVDVEQLNADPGVDNDLDDVRLDWLPPASPDGLRYLVTEVISGETRMTTGTSSVWKNVASPPFFVVRTVSDDLVGEAFLSGVQYDPPSITGVNAPAPAATPTLRIEWTPPVTPSLALPLVGYTVRVWPTADPGEVRVLRTTTTAIDIADLDPATSYEVSVSSETYFPSSPRSTATGSGSTP